MRVNLFLIFFVFTISSCSEDNWSAIEKDDFVNSCIKEGGTKKYCTCFMQNSMTKFPIAEDAKEMEFEEAVELSKDCK